MSCAPFVLQITATTSASSADGEDGGEDGAGARSEPAVPVE